MVALPPKLRFQRLHHFIKTLVIVRLTFVFSFLHSRPRSLQFGQDVFVFYMDFKTLSNSALYFFLNCLTWRWVDFNPASALLWLLSIAWIRVEAAFLSSLSKAFSPKASRRIRSISNNLELTSKMPCIDWNQIYNCQYITHKEKVERQNFLELKNDAWDSLLGVQNCSPATTPCPLAEEKISQQRQPQDPHDCPCSSWQSCPYPQYVLPP